MMKEIEIVCDLSEIDFKNEVNDLLSKGWELHGEMKVNTVKIDRLDGKNFDGDNVEIWYNQMMIKDVKE